MLRYLRLSNVGPAPHMRLEFAPRLNVLTGDNGLGKSFLLDMAWWALTRTWTGLPARPNANQSKMASIAFSVTDKVAKTKEKSRFDRANQSWTGGGVRSANPGLVLYAQVDGGFSVWDPARNYWRRKGANVDAPDRPAAYVFKPDQVWDGLPGNGSPLCNGLIRDWASWQKEGGQPLEQLTTVLTALSASPQEKLEPGRLTRISLDDVRDIPTLRMPYGQEVPVLHASAGIRRIIALAYLLVWAWQEHVRASELLSQRTTRQIIFLVDEVEAHLHPRWQRVILRALLAVVEKLVHDVRAEVQVISASHSPLVMASMESMFDSAKDAWFDIDLEGTPPAATVTVNRMPWIRRGDASRWLTGPAFDLPSAGSLDAEAVLEAAGRALTDRRISAADARKLDKQLRQVLGDTDPFWIRWRYVGQKRRWWRDSRSA